MKKLIFFPYHTVISECIKVEPWKVLHGEDFKILPSILTGWDCNSSLKAYRALKLDLGNIWNDCELAQNDSLKISVAWFSSGTSLRGVDFTTENISYSQGESSCQLQIDLSGQNLASDVVIRTQLVLAKNGESTSNLAPKIPGSILWQDEHRVLVEGRAARFPIEIIDFDVTTWTPSEGAWFLDWSKDNLYQSLLGGLRLYINAKHGKVIKAIKAEHPDAEDKAIFSTIYHDVGRTLITGALQNSEFVEDPSAFTDGSIGAAIRRLMKIVFPHDTPEGLRQRMTERSIDFECSLQAGLRLFLG